MLDSDRSVQQITYNGNNVSGTFVEVSSNYYKNTAMGMELFVIGTGAVIKQAANASDIGFTLVNFQDTAGSFHNGDFGISLQNAQLVFDNTINGTSGNDNEDGQGHHALNGTSGNDAIFGLAGNDDLRGVDGDDALHTGDGFDVASGGAGNDALYADTGNDVLLGDDGDDQLQDNDTLHAHIGNDSLLDRDMVMGAMLAQCSMNGMNLALRIASWQQHSDVACCDMKSILRNHASSL